MKRLQLIFMIWLCIVTLLTPISICGFNFGSLCLGILIVAPLLIWGFILYMESNEI